jgi:hypothetical protein
MMLEFLCCPESTCKLPAEVIDRWSLPSTDGPVAHVKTFCLAGHWFAMPEDALATRPARSASAGERASLG